MKDLSKTIQDCINYNPVALLKINSKVLLEKIDDILPYSTGFEIECSPRSKYNRTENIAHKDLEYVKAFKSIENIIDVNCDSSEQRFRIPPGLKGLICLQEISKNLIKYCELNPQSGIHYHIDFTDLYEDLSSDFVKKNSVWILKELEEWNYRGSFNTKDCQFNTGTFWVRFQRDFKTMEIRIGEMTFDYKLLLKRILHANEIARKLKSILGTKEERKERKLNEQLEELKEEPTNQQIDIRSIIKQRKININETDNNNRCCDGSEID
jgi:hypothetical protein